MKAYIIAAVVFVSALSAWAQEESGGAVMALNIQAVAQERTGLPGNFTPPAEVWYGNLPDIYTPQLLIQPTPAPEPSSILLAGFALALFVGLRKFPLSNNWR